MGMDVLEFIYLVCFFLGLGFAVLAALLSGVLGGHLGGHAGMDGGGHLDGGGAHEGGGHVHSDEGSVHYSPLSPVTIAMFIATFGGTGIVVKRYLNPHVLVHLGLAAVSAFIVGGLVSWIFWKILSTTQSTSQPRAEEAIGLEAEVTVPIPHLGLGEIAYTLRGTRLTSSAKTADNKELPARAVVRIVKQSGSTFIVEKA